MLSLCVTSCYTLQKHKILLIKDPTSICSLYPLALNVAVLQEYWIERAWYVCVAPADVVWCGPLAYGEATEEDNEAHGHRSSAWSYVVKRNMGNYSVYWSRQRSDVIAIHQVRCRLSRGLSSNPL
jgi:hypothetical protein